jgi:hypothetical protein
MEGYSDTFPFSPMAIPNWLIRALCWTLAIVSVTVAAWYGPMLTAAGWHVFHPSGRVVYRGLHVMVPWPWVSDADGDSMKADPTAAPDGISLKEMAHTAVHREPAQTMFITVITPDPGVSAEEQTERWLESFRATHPGSEFEEKVPVAIPTEAKCLGAHRLPDSHGIVWTCISVKGGWVANFEGHTDQEPVFFRVVAALGH